MGKVVPVINKWRFEYIKDRTSQWNQLKVGGFITVDEKEELFTAVVNDLQGFNQKAQFEPGFQLGTDKGTVELGEQEKWND